MAPQSKLTTVPEESSVVLGTLGRWLMTSVTPAQEDPIPLHSTPNAQVSTPMHLKIIDLNIGVEIKFSLAENL